MSKCWPKGDNHYSEGDWLTKDAEAVDRGAKTRETTREESNAGSLSAPIRISRAWDETVYPFISFPSVQQLMIL